MRKKLTDDLVALQEATPEQPYSILHRLKLAKAYKRLGYPDLAAGDAYKALLLIDEVLEEGEYHEEAFEAAQDDWLSKKVGNLAIEEQNEVHSDECHSAQDWAQTQCSRTAYVSNCTSPSIFDK
jgi:hypothetical protein